MAITASSLFSADELSYRDMVVDGGILVCDKWFGKDSSEVDRTRYQVAYLRRQARNLRRRARRKAAEGACHAQVQTEAADCVRHTQAPSGEAAGACHAQAPTRAADCVCHAQAPTEADSRHTTSGSESQREGGRRCAMPEAVSEREERLAQERRKCLRRSTIAACPTVGEIRTAWRFRNESEEKRIRLGGMLMDLECYVDNSLVTKFYRGRLRIVARHGGMRAWIRENCPELDPHYKTLQRIKGLAKSLRQRLDVLDPMPIGALMNERVSEAEIVSAEVHVQPRPNSPLPVEDRFVWEKSEVLYDADGRPYRHNENYLLANYDIPDELKSNLTGYRSLCRVGIILIGKEKCTKENYPSSGKERCGGTVGKDVGGVKWMDLSTEWMDLLAELGAWMRMEDGSGMWRNGERGMRSKDGKELWSKRGMRMMGKRGKGMRIGKEKNGGLRRIAQDMLKAYFDLMQEFQVYDRRRNPDSF